MLKKSSTYDKLIIPTLFYPKSYLRDNSLKPLYYKYFWWLLGYLALTQDLYPLTAALTDPVDPNTILLGLDQLAESANHLVIDPLGQDALKDAILDPVTKIFKGFGYLVPSVIIRYIIRYQIKQFYISSKK